ncbi:MAG: hypothetical protein A2Z34_00655 [Planctomycetes bacterium RBG_16_59_8]|nr:MAG: hypothetical protein A2Z34_00655 [Planctomycetes bacterium RBG_16_59_8]
MENVVPRTWVPGTPRGYGSEKVANEWLKQIEDKLGGYRGRGKSHSDTDRYEVDLAFLINPNSAKYCGKNLPHGTDLDNLVKQTVDGLAATKSRSLPSGLGILHDDSAVYQIVATKEHVKRDEDAGVWVTVRLLRSSQSVL